MIIGTKTVHDGKNEASYVIKDIYKNSDGSIDSYQVTISKKGYPDYDVVLDEDEMCTVAYFTSVAFDYIYQMAHGLYLYDFTIYGYNEKYLSDYFEITKSHTSPDRLDFRFDNVHRISLVDYCNCYCHRVIGVNILPRYTFDDHWYPECYQDHLDGGTHYEHKTELNGLENFEIVMHGMIWVTTAIRDMRGTMKDHDFIKYVINKHNDVFVKALNANNDIFDERIENIRNNARSDQE